ncbi:hypothetical protein Hanom_Chr16g01483211 [Helianthus anomalus]
MAIKLKPQGPRCKRFEFWTKVAKVTKPRGPKWQFTQININKISLELLRVQVVYAKGTSNLCRNSFKNFINSLYKLVKHISYE